jgi:DeoR family fructose operon transcriptional repressor
MFAEERQQKIYDIIYNRRSIRVSELSRMLNISEVTVRRDLDELQKQKRIIRTHGGAMAAYSVGRAFKSEELLPKNNELKKKIALAAYETIDEYDTLLMDSSSTVFELIRLIATGKKTNLRVITTSLLAVQTLSNCKNCKVMIVGGEVNYSHSTIEGYVASKFIKDIRVDKCFVGINGIDEEFGFSTPRYEDAEIKSLMIASAIKSFILADHTKFGKTYLAKVDPCSCLITDTGLPDFSYDTIEENSDIIFADSET